MALPMLIPAEQFTEAGAYRVRRGNRMQIRFGERTYDGQGEVIDIVPAEKPKGVAYIEDATLELVKEFLNMSRTHIQHFTEDWQNFEDQLEGKVPTPVEGMEMTTGVNMAVGVHAASIGMAKRPLETAQFFRYLPRDFTPVGLQLAASMEEISRADLFQDEHWQFERDQAALWASLCGLAMMTLEHERKIEPVWFQGNWHDEVKDRGTRPYAISPYNTYYTDFKQPDIERQAAIGFVREVEIPLLQTDSIAVMIHEVMKKAAEGAGVSQELAWPEGKYFNLDKVADKVTARSYHDQTDGKQHAMTALEAAMRNTLAFTFWTKIYDARRLYANATTGDYRASDAELAYWLGWTPQDAQYARIWKLTAVCTSPAYGTPGGTTPDLMIQIQPSRYSHNEYPAGWIHCIDFCGRTVSLSNAAIMYHLNKFINVLMTVSGDTALKNAMNIWVLARHLLASGQLDDGRFTFIPNLVLEMEEGRDATDAKNVLQRLEFTNPGLGPAIAMANTMVGAVKETTSSSRLPVSTSGEQTAYEISQYLEQGAAQTGVNFGKNLRYFHGRVARHQASNNAQFLTVQDGIRKAGMAGLDLRKFQNVARYQKVMGVSVWSGLPVKVRVLGGARIQDELARAKVLSQITTTPLFAVWVQMGDNMPQKPRRLLEFILSLALDDPSMYVAGDERRTTREILEVLAMGEMVEVDLDRFHDPDPITTLRKMHLELRAVQGLAARGCMAAKLYGEDLQREYDALEAHLKMMAQKFGPPGGQGRGVAQPGTVGRGFQEPRGNTLTRPGTETMATEMMKTAVPTMPIAG